MPVADLHQSIEGPHVHEPEPGDGRIEEQVGLLAHCSRMRGTRQERGLHDERDDVGNARTLAPRHDAAPQQRKCGRQILVVDGAVLGRREIDG